MSLLRFDCRFGYPAGFALDLSFEAGAGVTALVGPSGSGKTTALNLIAGLLTPASGTITLGDKPLFRSAPPVNVPPERRAIGYVFQDYQLFPQLSVLDNLRYGQRRTGRKTVSLEKVVDTLELAGHLRQPPATLSGGQKQRVALGRALLRSPELLLLDEPLSALDLDLRRSVQHYLRRVIDEFHIPTILVTHDQEGVTSLANELVVLARDR